MPIPQKGYKTINHRDMQYRWIMQNQRGVNELIIYACEAVDGQAFIAQLPKVVSYEMVTKGIDYGNANGWSPREAGEPFRCKWSRGSFQPHQV